MKVKVILNWDEVSNISINSNVFFVCEVFLIYEKKVNDFIICCFVIFWNKVRIVSDIRWEMFKWGFVCSVVNIIEVNIKFFCWDYILYLK